ncbi:hypothetical protein DPMN_103219 [Dreissena polymorpha]|uniref:Uncharacterized protein n=1 Tax=Dreissena polymorpha TaxID=45954 RepID=A0A9D4JYZ8_DREPO|nr:hypothetical protein DPMN_103219 [Dreissena polymorpha]
MIALSGIVRVAAVWGPGTAIYGPETTVFMSWVFVCVLDRPETFQTPVLQEQ